MPALVNDLESDGPGLPLPLVTLPGHQSADRFKLNARKASFSPMGLKGDITRLNQDVYYATKDAGALVESLGALIEATVSLHAETAEPAGLPPAVGVDAAIFYIARIRSLSPVTLLGLARSLACGTSEHRELLRMPEEDVRDEELEGKIANNIADSMYSLFEPFFLQGMAVLFVHDGHLAAGALPALPARVSRVSYCVICSVAQIHQKPRSGRSDEKHVFGAYAARLISSSQFRRQANTRCYSAKVKNMLECWQMLFYSLDWACGRTYLTS
jgi:hypothetical protein